MSAGQPEVDLRNVHIFLTTEGRPAVLRATFPSGAMIPVAATLYDAENGEARAWRVATQCLEIIYGPHGRVRAKASLQAGAEASLEELALFASLQATAPDAKVCIEVEVDEQLLDLGHVEMQGQDQSGGWPWLGLSLDVVRQVAAAAGKTMPPTPLASVNNSAWQLEIMCALASERFMRLDFTPERGIPRKFAAMLAYSWAEVGDTVVGVVGRRPIINDQRARGRRQIGFGTARILDGFVTRLANWSPDKIERTYARQLEIMADEGDILALGDLRVVALQRPGDQWLKSDLPKRLGASPQIAPGRRKRTAR